MSMAFFSIPLMVFLVFVAPLWLWLHYRSKRQLAQGLNREDAEKMETLSRKAETLQSRMENLERILDIEAPTWRQR